MTTLTLPSDQHAAVQAFPQLRRLVTTHTVPPWAFRPHRSGSGVLLLTGGRAWIDGWNEAIAILNGIDAKAFRLNPDNEEVWSREGTLREVVDGLVDLPAPDHPKAPRLAKGRCLWRPGMPL